MADEEHDEQSTVLQEEAKFGTTPYSAPTKLDAGDGIQWTLCGAGQRHKKTMVVLKKPMFGVAIYADFDKVKEWIASRPQMYMDQAYLGRTSYWLCARTKIPLKFRFYYLKGHDDGAVNKNFTDLVEKHVNCGSKDTKMSADEIEKEVQKVQKILPDAGGSATAGSIFEITCTDNVNVSATFNGESIATVQDGTKMFKAIKRTFLKNLESLDILRDFEDRLPNLVYAENIESVDFVSWEQITKNRKAVKKEKLKAEYRRHRDHVKEVAKKTGNKIKAGMKKKKKDDGPNAAEGEGESTEGESTEGEPTEGESDAA